jgi:hypothetical protein
MADGVAVGVGVDEERLSVLGVSVAGRLGRKKFLTRLRLGLNADSASDP